MTSTINAEFAVASFDDFVGQHDLKRRIDIAVTSAIARKQRMDHVLLDGPRGVGKSTIANLIGERLQLPTVTISEPPSVAQMLNHLYDTELGAIVLCDEFHIWPKSTLNAMLPLLEAQWFGDQFFPYQVFVAATTDMQMLSGPLVDRFPIHGLYETYSDPEMTQIVERFAARANVHLDDETCHQLGVASAGSPRVARSFVIAARDLEIAEGEPTVADIMQLCKRSPDGLSTQHLDYLKALHANRGRAGLETLVNRLRLHRNLVMGLEQLLLDRKLIYLSTDGRRITAAGRARLEEEKVA